MRFILLEIATASRRFYRIPEMRSNATMKCAINASGLTFCLEHILGFEFPLQWLKGEVGVV